MNREPIYAATLALLQTITGAPYGLTVPTFGRGFKHWEDVPADQRPAVFLVPVTEHSQGVRGQPTKWTIKCEIWVYVSDQPGTLGVQALNPVLDAIEAVIAPKSPAPQYANTLGGLVHSCMLNGTANIHGGFIAGTAVAVVPLEIIAV